MATSSAPLKKNSNTPVSSKVQSHVQRIISSAAVRRAAREEQKSEKSRFDVKTHYIVRGHQDHDYILRDVHTVLLTKSMVDAIVSATGDQGIDLSPFKRAPAGTHDDKTSHPVTLDAGIMEATRRHFKSGAPQRPIRAKMVEKLIVGPNHMPYKAHFYQVIDGHAKAAWSIALGYTHVPLIITLGGDEADAHSKLTPAQYRSIDEGRL